MTERFATTPFGGARMRASIFRLRENIEERRAALQEGGNDTGRADKWRLLRALTEARAAFGLSDRTIAVLEALASCWPDKELDGSKDAIVFPSNAELSLRLRGMAPATIRRHLAALVEAGMILRRDSANGKRYCRRDDRGLVESAFGFDLSPFALAAAEIFEAADIARAEARELHRLRTEITIHQRDIAKIIEAGLHEGRAGDWDGFLLRLAAAGGRLSRNASALLLQQRREDLVRLRAEVEHSYLTALTEQEMSANDSENERHIQNSNTDLHLEKGFEQKLKQNREAPQNVANSGTEAENGEPAGRAVTDPEDENPPGGLETKSAPVSLQRIKAACPQLADYAKNGLNSWQDVFATAALVRSMLGISPDAWEKAREAMGSMTAAVAIAAILERADEIRSPGGYLRALTSRAEEGKFSIMPVIVALENR